MRLINLARVKTVSHLLPVQMNRVHSWIPPTGYKTSINVYNCIAKENVPIILRHQNCATWYTCGPTVYDSSHIGHASCYVKVDIIQKILRDYFNINLITVMNITDIDDKIIKQCNEQKRTWREVAEENETSFWQDLKKLNVSEPDMKLRVSENIVEIIDYIQKLMEMNVAYIGKDGSVYFKVNEYGNYGKLQRIHIDEMAEHSVKQSLADFALWKLSKPGEPSWVSPWGPGRPGWHIECSTIASKIFGDNVDFHAGGLDLRFPHHENEEAQCCAFHGKSQWVNYWLHTGQLTLKGQQEKMSKSLKNTISISEMLETNDSNIFRMACMLSNYRNGIAYANETMLTAKKTFERLLSVISDMDAYVSGKKSATQIDSSEMFAKISETANAIDIALRNDFDTAKAVGQLVNLASHVGKAINSSSNLHQSIFADSSSSNVSSIIATRHFLRRMLNIFGFVAENISYGHKVESAGSDLTILHDTVDNIVDLRNRLRTQAASDTSLFRVSDEIRNALKLTGIEVKDHGKDSSWHLLKK